MINEIDPKIYNFKNLKLEDQLVVASQFKMMKLKKKSKIQLFREWSVSLKIMIILLKK